MATVTRIARYRAVAHRDIPLDSSAGDSDLWPIAGLLWLGSVVLVALTFVHRQTFDVEATLALLCVFALPALFVRSRNVRRTTRQ